MGKTVQVRDLDPLVQQRLKQEARSRGLSLSEYLRRELTALVARAETRARWEDELPEPLPDLDLDAILAEIRERRGPLP